MSESTMNENTVNESAMNENQETTIVEKKGASLSIYDENSPIRKIAEKRIKELQDLNPGINVEFINVFSRVKMDTKGRFYFELGNEEFNLSDSVDVVIMVGEQMFQYWDSEENNLICSSPNKVTNFNGEPCSNCQYDHENCKLRYGLIFKLADGEDDDLYSINLPTTGTLAFGDYLKILKKKHKKSVLDVVTSLYTQEKNSKEDSSRKYNAILFKYARDARKE